MNRYRSVVFDLDGTLVDSSPDIAAALNAVFVPRGGRSLSAAEVAPMLGEGVRRLVSESLAAAGLPAEAPEVDAAVPAYLERYRAHPVVDSTLYDGVAATLEWLSANGFALGICTNKPEGIAHQVLSGLGIAARFDAVVGGDRLDTCKPHPAHLLATFAELSQDPRHGLYVGDSAIDAQCARAAEVDFRAVEWAPAEVAGERLQPFGQLITDLGALAHHATEERA